MGAFLRACTLVRSSQWNRTKPNGYTQPRPTWTNGYGDHGAEIVGCPGRCGPAGRYLILRHRQPALMFDLDETGGVPIAMSSATNNIAMWWTNGKANRIGVAHVSPSPGWRNWQPQGA